MRVGRHNGVFRQLEDRVDVGVERTQSTRDPRCADTKDFEGVGKVLIENYSGTHLREGSRSWTGRGNPQQHGKSTGKGYGYGKGKPSSKGSYSQAAYAAYPDDGEDHAEPWDEVVNQSWEDDSYVGLLGDIAEEEPGSLEGDNEFDYFDDVDEMSMSMKQLHWTACLILKVQKTIDRQETLSSYNLLLSLRWGKQVARANPLASPKEKAKERLWSPTSRSIRGDGSSQSWSRRANVWGAAS